MCLVEGESNYNTSAKGPGHDHPGFDFPHGLFQIHSAYWCHCDKCNTRGTSNLCGIDCDSKSLKIAAYGDVNAIIVTGLLDDDIRDDIVCVKRIYNDRLKGFNAWQAWRDHCQSGSERMKEAQRIINNCSKLSTLN